MKLEILSNIILLTTLISAKAQCIDPNDPSCQCTNNCDVVTNQVTTPIPNGSLAIRIVSIQPYNTTDGSDIFLAMTNSGFWSDGTNTFIGENTWLVSPQDAFTNSHFKITLGVINTDTNESYYVFRKQDDLTAFGIAIETAWTGVGTNEHFSYSFPLNPSKHNFFFYVEEHQ